MTNPQNPANVFSKCLYTVTVIFKTDALNHNAVSSHSLRTFSLNKRHTDILHHSKSVPTVS